MKTTLEIPDDIFREAKARAAKSGVPLRTFITDAVREKLQAPMVSAEKPWMKSFGVLRHLHEETLRIDRIIEEEFETIDPEDWVGSIFPKGRRSPDLRL